MHIFPTTFLEMAVKTKIAQVSFFLLRILQLSSEFNQTIGNIACFLRKSFDLLGEIEENDNRN